MPPVQAVCALVCPRRIAVAGHREVALARLGICLCVTAALGSFRTYFDSWVNPFDLLGAVKSCGAGYYAAFRGSIARTLDAVSTARYERTLAPSSSLDNS